MKYTGPDGVRRYAPHTFARREDAETWVGQTRREIERGQVVGRTRPEQVTFGAYAVRWLANRHVSGRPIKDRTREHYSASSPRTWCPSSGTADCPRSSPRTCATGTSATLVERPTMRSHCLLAAADDLRVSAITEELIDANPCRIVGAGRSKRVHKIRPASVAELGELTAAMPERLRLMVTLASWCALRFGEAVELRHGDIDLSDEVIRIRRGAVRAKGGTYTITTPKSDAGMRDVAIPPHVIPLIEAHMAKYVGAERDSLIFATEGGAHLQPSTLYRHWYKARDAAGRAGSPLARFAARGLVLAAATGATLAELMARAGHSTPQAAMRYQHVAQGRDREVAALLSKLADAL